MTQQPRFEGNPIEAVQIRMSGTGGLGRMLAMGEEVFVLVRGHVVGVDHADKRGVFTRTHKLEIDEARELPEELSPQDLLEQATDLAAERGSVVVSAAQ